MNIQDALCRLRGSKAQVSFLEPDGSYFVTCYEAIYENALLLLGALEDMGFRSRRLYLDLRGLRNRVTALWACWLGNVAPIQGLRSAAVHGPVVLTDTLDESFTEPHDASCGDAAAIYYHSLKSGRYGKSRAMDDGDTALLQYTSGTASSPRMAVLTGANLWEGAAASSVVTRDRVDERYLSWLPLSHIFGLVGYHLVPMWGGYGQFLIDTGAFLKNPSVWLEKCSEWGCTVTGATPFGLGLAKRALRERPEGSDPPDLSSVNVCFCGGENLDAGALFDFERAAAPYGWRPGALCPAYGLSEAAMGVSYKPPGEDIRVDRIKPQSTAIGRKLDFFGDDGADTAIERVSLGVLDECNEAVICDLEGCPLPEGHLGVIRIRGRNVCARLEPEASPPNPDADGWLDTGDLGYFRQGRLSLFARHKEVICRNGLNYPLLDIEKSASRAAGGIGIALAEATGGAVLFSADGPDGALRAAARAVSEEWGLPVAGIAKVRDLPRSVKGTVDRLALSVGWESGLYEKSALAPDTNGEDTRVDGLSCVEAALASVWSEILEIPREAVSKDSRFMEMGGDSLSLFDLAAAIERDFCVYAETADLAKAWTLSECALLVERLCVSAKSADLHLRHSGP
ncbi:MAG: non-ribosomal peptide synthetase [Synergistaceae bacterium]|jgi:acyl-CoA synthetase (AMP-forming)/AMP-acid ligase II/acyl carrier protein|nr:non-ribosomal peptide synthetase [Synergistaceae bacterium]